MNVQTINKLFREYGRTLGSVESFTGGLFAREITKVSGASHFFKGALVTYGVVSREVAAQMASNGQKLLNVDYCVSFTGNAGPTAMEGKPVGLVYIGIAIYDKVEVYEFHLSGDRDTIQNEGVINALKILEQKILENN